MDATKCAFCGAGPSGEFRTCGGDPICEGCVEDSEAAIREGWDEPREDHHAPLEPDDGRDARGLGGPCLGHACNCVYEDEPCGERGE